MTGADNNVRVLKSGVWYTAANFITKSIGFLTTPIFSRLLTHNDFGLYSNFTSWLSTITVFVTLNLGTTFISARYDFEDDFDSYISSMLVLSSIVAAAWTIVLYGIPSFFVELTGIDFRYLKIMMLYLLLFSAVDMFQARERYYYKYKLSAATSVFLVLSTAFLSVVFVVWFENKLLGRILGSVLPTVAVGIFLYITLIYKGKKVEIKYWKYGLPVCLPYIPHVLSLTLLNSMDKLMITKICGTEDNALYSLAYSCGAIVSLFITSLNTAFSPWLGQKLQEKSYGEIRKVSKWYMILFAYLACGVMLLSPELLLVMGGSSYYQAIYVMPPVALGCVCQFLYTMHVNVEQFHKKTFGMAVASMAAALSNYILNRIFIPEYGYIAAAYTTFVSFFILLFIHMFLVWRLGLSGIYPKKIIFLVISFMLCYAVFVQFLYLNYLARYAFCVVYVGGMLLGVIKYKEYFIGIFKNF